MRLRTVGSALGLVLLLAGAMALHVLMLSGGPTALPDAGADPTHVLLVDSESEPSSTSADQSHGHMLLSCLVVVGMALGWRVHPEPSILDERLLEEPLGLRRLSRAGERAAGAGPGRDRVEAGILLRV